MATTEDAPVELTIAEAAELLNVNQAHLLRQISAGTVPCQGAGSRRTLMRETVLAYRARMDAQASQALDTMTTKAEDAGLYG